MSKEKSVGFYYAVRLKNAFVYEAHGDGTPVLHASKRVEEDCRRDYIQPEYRVVVKVKIVEVEK